jgi:hypothetical protein
MPQFTGEEAQRIFARAAEKQHSAEDVSPRLSLEELKEIGQAAGLSPEHVATAVAEMRTDPAPPNESTKVLGVQTEIRRSRILPGELTDEMWNGMVSRLRRTFTTQGITADIGRSREWTGTNSKGDLSNLHLEAVPVEGGTRVTLETSKTDEVRQMKWVPLPFAALATLFLFIGAAKDKPAVWALALFFAVVSAAIHIGTRRDYGAWSKRRQGEFDALLDHFELMMLNAKATEATHTSSMMPSSPSPLGQTLNDLAERPDDSSAHDPQRLRS